MVNWLESWADNLRRHWLWRWCHRQRSVASGSVLARAVIHLSDKRVRNGLVYCSMFWMNQKPRRLGTSIVVSEMYLHSLAAYARPWIEASSDLKLEFLKSLIYSSSHPSKIVLGTVPFLTAKHIVIIGFDVISQLQVSWSDAHHSLNLLCKSEHLSDSHLPLAALSKSLIVVCAFAVLHRSRAPSRMNAFMLSLISSLAD